MRQVIIYPGEDGYWVIECPSLPGCISQGKTKEEAIENIKEAIRGYVAALEEDHLPIPEERYETLVWLYEQTTKDFGPQVRESLREGWILFQTAGRESHHLA